MKVSEELFLRVLFSNLNERKIMYGVLRNAEVLPDSLGGGDIDVLVASGTLRKVAQNLANSAESCGGKVMSLCRYPHFYQMMFMGCSEGRWWGCCIDLFEGVFCNGVLPIAGDSLLERRVRTLKGVWTLDDETGQYLGFVKELVTNGVISNRYMLGAKKAIAAGKDDFVLSRSLRRFVGETLNGEHHSTKGFRRAWMVSLALRRPIYFWKNWYGFQFARMWRLIRPCGKMVAVMGTDGAGKTALLTEILPVIKTMNHNSTVVRHLKPDILPPLGKFRGVKYELGHVCATPHASRPSGIAGSIFRVSYLICDYVLGYWFKVRVKIAKTPIPYWIFDRYAYDLLIDPRRFRVRLPDWIIKVFLCFVPRPDLILCLGGDARKIYARKPETSIDEVGRQVEAIKKFCKRNSRAVWIDTTTSLTETVDAALRAILERLSLNGWCNE